MMYWDFEYELETYEMFQLFWYLYEMKFSASLIYQLRWAIYETWSFSGGSISEYFLYVRTFMVSQFALGSYNLSITEQISLEYHFYSAKSAAILQRMFYFNTYASVDVTVLNRWYKDWIAFGYAFDLSNYGIANWSITLTG